MVEAQAAIAARKSVGASDYSALRDSQARVLDDICHRMREAVPREDRRWLAMTYNNCIDATEIVDWLSEQSYCSTRKQAVEIGRSLQKMKYIVHVWGSHTKLAPFDDMKMFFYYTEMGEAARGHEPEAGTGRARAPTDKDIEQLIEASSAAEAYANADASAGYVSEAMPSAPAIQAKMQVLVTAAPSAAAAPPAAKHGAKLHVGFAVQDEGRPKAAGLLGGAGAPMMMPPTSCMGPSEEQAAAAPKVSEARRRTEIESAMMEAFASGGPPQSTIEPASTIEPTSVMDLRPESMWVPESQMPESQFDDDDDDDDDSPVVLDLTDFR